MKQFALYFILFLFFTPWGYGQNTMISNQRAPNEPSIVINPKHPNILIAGANLNNYYVSTDTGRTWTQQVLTSSHGVWGDPTLAVDTSNNFYFFHLANPPLGSWIDRIVCQKSTTNGASWSNGSAVGLNGTKKQDKQWCAIDRTNNIIYLTWTQFDRYQNPGPADSSIILFARSEDEGETWSIPKRISSVAGDCFDDDNTVEGAVPTVGANGEVYVAWSGPNGIVFNKSTDRGHTWLPHETFVDSMPGGWNYKVSGIYRANGLPVTTCDLSNGPNHGTIYINWSDQRNGIHNTDVWLTKSTDGGTTWTPPTKVNTDSTNRQQFFTWMTIDQATGYLHFVFYDRRNHTTDSTDVYLAVSKDGGQTFTNRKISQSPFLPDEGIFFGDYTNITAHNNIVRPIWTRLNNGQLSVWTDLGNIDSIPSPVNTDEVTKQLFGFENYPNPSENTLYVSYKLHGESTVNLALYNLEGVLVSHIIKNENKGYGKYIERINTDELNIPSGVFLLRLEINGIVKTVRQVIVK